MTLSTEAVSGAQAPDIVDTMAGLVPGTTTFDTRHRRAKVVTATQNSYLALFDPALADLSLAERLWVAQYACVLSGASALADHYVAQLAALPPQAADARITEALASGTLDAIDPRQNARLHAILTFTHTLMTAPVKGDREALAALPAAGLTTPAVVALSQLIAFLSYQVRLTAGLQALRKLNEGAV